MNNINEKISYFSSITTILYSAAIAYGTASIASIWCGCLSSPEDSIALGIFAFYLLLSAGMKRLELDEEGIVFFYYLRPFARRYRYRYEDVKKGYYESLGLVGSFPLFIFTTLRNHPLGPIKKKYIFFINKDEKGARGILLLLKDKNVQIVIKSTGNLKKYLMGETDKLSIE